MKPIITVTTGLILASAALAQDTGKLPAQVPTGAAQVESVQTGAKKLANPVDESLATLRKQVLAGEASPEAFKGLKEAVRTLGGKEQKANARSAKLSQRLEQRIADLEQRAQAGTATEDDFAILQEQVIDTRVDHAIAELAQKTEAASVSSEDFQQLGALLTARGAAAGRLDPQAAQENQKVIRTLNGVEQKSGKGKLKPADFQALRSTLAESRLDRAMADLEKRAIAKTASPADYARVKDVVSDRTETIGTPDAKALEERLQGALDKLKDKAAKGEVTAEEFAKVRDNLLKKAREAKAAPAEDQGDDE